MKIKTMVFLLGVFVSGALDCVAQSTAFTYQGRLNEASGPATGLYDLAFTLYTDPTNGYAVGGGTITNAATPVTKGLFTVTLDFGYGVFDGSGRWLELAVQPAGGTNFATLAPRQAVTPSPMASYATKAGSAITANVANQATFTMNSMNASHANSANSVPASGITGMLDPSQLPAGLLTNGAAGVSLTGTFAGDGSGLSNVTVAASAITGTLADNKLSANVALLNATNQTFTGTNAFAGVVLATNANNVIGGTFIGALSPSTLPAALLTNGAAGVTLNGRFAGDGSGLTNLPGAAVPAGVLTNNASLVSLGGNFYGEFFGGFIGDGSTLVALNAAQLASGTVPDARLAGNVARLNATNQTYTGTNTFTGVLIATNANNVIGGTFTGSGAGLTQLNGSVLATGSVGNGALAAASVTADKLAAGQVVKSVNGLRDAVTLTAGANIALATNGNSLQISAAGAAAPWSLTGNSGNSGNIFLGTTDYTPLELRVNNTRALLIQMNYQDGNYSAQMVGGSPANFIAPGVIGSVVVGGGINNYYYLGNNYTNSVSSDFSFLGGGLGNSIQYGGYISFLGGGSENSIQPYVEYAFLGGGFGNAIQPYASRSFLGGGFFNSIQMNANYSFLGGGSYNSIQTNANYSFLGGGSQNSIQPYADGSFLGGGYNNSIQANAYDSFLGGGEFNTNGAVYSVVPGGDRNYAGGQNSFAAGHRAKANFAGDFVWADSQDADFNATATNQFSVRAAGGVQFVTAGSGLTIDGPVIATAIAGNGGGLTNLTVPVAALSGTLADAQLSANIARLNAGQTFTGNQTVAGNLVVSPGNGTLTVTNDGGVIPGLVASGGGAPGHLRFRNYLEIFPNFANTAAGALDVRNTNGTATLTLDGQTGSLTGDTSFVRQILNLYGSGYGIGVQRLTTYFRSGGGYAWFNGGAHNDNQNNSGGGTTLMTLDSSGNVSAASFNGAFIGGTGNTTPASDPLSVVSGGLNNAIQTGASKSVIAGGEQNLIQTNSDHAAIGGGWLNFIGQNNYEAAIASGYQNGISNNAGYSLIGGGQGNTIMFGSDHSVIAGGVYNYINTNAAYSFIGGGYNQNILGNAEYSSIGGGWGSACGGAYSTVPGGRGNFAGGQYSFAAGYRAKATNNGAFVWSDGTGTITSSTNDNQFVARASGGVIFYSSTGSSGVSLAAGSGTWSSMSDRNAKEQFQQVNPQAVLARVSALPMTTWSYKTEPGVRHVGPMAQDFYAAFAVGPDDKHITTVDESGVALAAIQGLNQKVEDRSQNSEVRIQKLETENAELKQQLAGLKAMVEKLAGKIGR